MPAAMREITRVLEPGCRLCLAVVHQINSAGRFETDAADAPVIRRDYLARALTRTWSSVTGCHYVPARFSRNYHLETYRYSDRQTHYPMLYTPQHDRVVLYNFDVSNHLLLTHWFDSNTIIRPT
jgi:hypothetical protein